MTIPDPVARHYGRADIVERIDDGLRAAGLDPAHMGIDDLKPVDHLHTGGIEATAALLDQLDIGPATRVVDVGCGVGGTARHVRHRYGARVHGIDLTPEFVAAGRVLNDRLGLSDGIELREGDAAAMPWDDGSFDLALMLHVGMNVPDKAALIAEVARVLAPGGRFALFEVMRGEAEGALTFPLPWARDQGASHVGTPEAYRRAAHDAGLVQIAERDRRDFALGHIAQGIRKAAAEGASPLGQHILIGDDLAPRLRNYVSDVEARRLRPVEMIFERPR